MWEATRRQSRSVGPLEPHEPRHNAWALRPVRDVIGTSLQHRSKPHNTATERDEHNDKGGQILCCTKQRAVKQNSHWEELQYRRGRALYSNTGTVQESTRHKRQLQSPPFPGPAQHSLNPSSERSERSLYKARLPLCLGRNVLHHRRSWH